MSIYEHISKKSGITVGVDIGTTNISIAAIDIATGKQCEARSVPNSSGIPSADDYISEQSVNEMLKKANALLDEVLDKYSDVVAIGVTGQMHGLVYVDKHGNAVSELINWQDKRAERIISNGESCCAAIQRLTGQKIAAGYALATHYYNMLFGLVPKDAVSFCSIMDLFAMVLTGREKPLVHVSVAASFGLFDTKRLCFDFESISKLGIGDELIPGVTADNVVCGEYRSIPVSVPIGDNQASFLGTVKHPDRSVLINIGTGSQISVMSDYTEVGASVELRPYVSGKYLICGSALCGGASYAILEGFFRECAVRMGIKDRDLYDLMNKLAEEAYYSGIKVPDVGTQFRGTRADQSQRGTISGIDDGNFTPSALTLGFIKGICSELYGYYLDSAVDNKTEAVASGGGVQKNTIMQKVISDMFCMPLYLSAAKEEAASGAALFSAMAVGSIKNMDELSYYINYKE